MNKVIAVVMNYNQDEQSRKINSKLSCESYIVDSSGIEKYGMIKSEQKFYTGNFNKACKIFIESNADYCIFICSDIICDFKRLVRKVSLLDKNIGIYSPKIKGTGNQIKGKCTDGCIIVINRKIIEIVYPIIDNKYGHGIDLFCCMICKKLGFKLFIDEKIKAIHTNGKSYDNELAKKEFKVYFNNKGLNNFVKDFPLIWKWKMGVCLRFPFNYLKKVTNLIRR